MSHWLLKVESGGSSLLVVHEWELAGGVSPPTLCGSRYVANDRLRHRLIGYARASRVVAVKLEYAMSVNRAERDALANMLSGDRSRSVTCGSAGLGDGGDDDGGGEAEDDDSLERRRVPGRGRACSPRPTPSRPSCGSTPRTFTLPSSPGAASRLAWPWPTTSRLNFATTTTS